MLASEASEVIVDVRAKSVERLGGFVIGISEDVQASKLGNFEELSKNWADVLEMGQE